ncbi:MAG TPA: MFS transporter [Xanthobacteraceae bacterium]|nr:MFS transporter [Xanthobacteraceae bacterium]
MQSAVAVEGGKRQPSSRSQRGLDWFAFFLADIQTGWGPFVAAYLTSKSWTQLDIGLILTVGTLAAMAMQIPIGALVDQVPAKRLLAAIAVVAISGSALLLAFWPVFSVVLGAKLLHAMASCLAGPVLASISLGLVGYTLLSSRLGRNARFLSLGNAIAAGLMGGVAYFYSNQAIFLLTAALAIPTLLSLAQIRSADIDPELARGGLRKGEDVGWSKGFAGVANRPFLIFAAAIVLFQLSNAAMLPIMAGSLTNRSPQWATAVIAICILAPQFVVAAIAPWVGRMAQSWGRRPLLILCFAPLCIRGAVFAVSSDPAVVIAAQLLDGISAATLGVLMPLVIADTTRGTGHFNFAQGVAGVAIGIGASLSTSLAGYVADMFGDAATFLFLASFGSFGLLLVLALMPETRGPR